MPVLEVVGLPCWNNVLRKGWMIHALDVSSNIFRKQRLDEYRSSVDMMVQDRRCGCIHGWGILSCRHIVCMALTGEVFELPREEIS